MIVQSNPIVFYITGKTFASNTLTMGAPVIPVKSVNLFGHCFLFAQTVVQRRFADRQPPLGLQTRPLLAPTLYPYNTL
jgi:hypothetical protein